MQERVQKLIAGAGLCSRRTAEDWIRAGRVTVNGHPAALGQTADPETDTVLVDGVPLARSVRRTYIMLNKPRGYVTTLSDEKGRRTVAELVADAGVRVYPIGRLDLDSEGLLLLTDDGEAANRLMHPAHQAKKTYHVTVRGPKILAAAAEMAALTRLGEDVIRPAQVEVLSENRDTGVLAVTIGEGRNRQVRRMCQAVGLRVVRLRRLAEGGIRLDPQLASGKWRYLTAEETALLTGTPFLQDKSR